MEVSGLVGSGTAIGSTDIARSEVEDAIVLECKGQWSVNAEMEEEQASKSSGCQAARSPGMHLAGSKNTRGQSNTAAAAAQKQGEARINSTRERPHVILHEPGPMNF